LRFAAPGPGRTIGLVWRKTSPRRGDFEALGALVKSLMTQQKSKMKSFEMAGAK
jgi:LysR family hydrogen peroxide-inducible transcriptional activator